jgi:hypothetical protein
MKHKMKHKMNKEGHKESYNAGQDKETACLAHCAWALAVMSSSALLSLGLME